jgi:hypothetical protein
MEQDLERGGRQGQRQHRWDATPLRIRREQNQGCNVRVDAEWHLPTDGLAGARDSRRL